ncbi:DNA phosphorothioation-dependent restriction protein DptG [Salimicrobium flavidum]|uniref:DNA phosphorothioation-dependent restriction protein DptG n=1 Tax=Salimicrobium flavidum TaxID=570947 RepID=A0A1N7KPC7_9BACI|nr:DNA phosphorothioation-dependent restriction protein DptG [Salimicrobium flavidum]SIS63356.1 DNA phosphorothioation-dependent restriction protein DptG [Salimicrobium flavidum]
MNNKLQVEKLNEIINPSRHSRGNVNEVLPFAANDSKALLKGDFKPIVGEFARQVAEEKLSDEEDPLKIKETPDSENYSIVKEMTAEVEGATAEKYDLERLLKKLLFHDQDSDVKVLHPYIFKYYPLTSKKKKSLEKKVAKFLKDVLVNNSREEVSKSFVKQGNEDLLVSMILDHLDELNSVQNAKSYQNLLPNLSELFVDDFFFISKYEDYFLENFQVLLQHYYFVYVSQLTFAFSKLENGSLSKVEPLFYTLDWESLNKRRKAFDGVYNFRNLREKSQSTFIHVHVQSQLSHNWLNEDMKFMSYAELYDLLNEEVSAEEKDAFLEDIKEWLTVYGDKMGVEVPINISSINEAFSALFTMLSKGMSEEVSRNYGKLIEDAAYGKFLKARGSLGQTLNITQDFLLLLTALAVKDKGRIPLKQLFEEFEKRGIALDQYSRKETMILLDNLNIIEKKSDSGDAQYVKSIL